MTEAEAPDEKTPAGPRPRNSRSGEPASGRAGHARRRVGRRQVALDPRLRDLHGRGPGHRELRVVAQGAARRARGSRGGDDRGRGSRVGRLDRGRHAAGLQRQPGPDGPRRPRPPPHRVPALRGGRSDTHAGDPRDARPPHAAGAARRRGMGVRRGHPLADPPDERDRPGRVDRRAARERPPSAARVTAVRAPASRAESTHQRLVQSRQRACRGTVPPGARPVGPRDQGAGRQGGPVVPPGRGAAPAVPQRAPHDPRDSRTTARTG